MRIGTEELTLSSVVKHPNLCNLIKIPWKKKQI